jgi:hypothetical protein
MGIYANGCIFGIKIYNSIDDECNTLFETKYDRIITNEQIKEVYFFYEELPNKENIFFRIYTECSSTYGEGTYMDWYPMSKELFLEKFSKIKLNQQLSI